MGARYTVSEIAERLDTDREITRGLVKFLEKVGLAEHMGERRPANSRGGVENVYSLIDGYELELSDRLKDANLT